MPSDFSSVALVRDDGPHGERLLLSSETYRGCAAAVSYLRARVTPQTPIFEIVQAVEDADRALGASTTFPMGSDGACGAALVLASAWRWSQSGLTAAQMEAALESERIYAAQLFIQARERESRSVAAP